MNAQDIKTIGKAGLLLGMSAVAAHALGGGDESTVTNFISQSQAWIIRALVIGVGTIMAIIQTTKMHSGDPEGLRKVGYSVAGIVLGLFIPTIINILAGFAGVGRG